MLVVQSELDLHLSEEKFACVREGAKRGKICKLETSSSIQNVIRFTQTHKKASLRILSFEL
jgi:hypothetical protein